MLMDEDNLDKSLFFLIFKKRLWLIITAYRGTEQDPNKAYDQIYDQNSTLDF